jgi:hypothetical protein
MKKFLCIISIVALCISLLTIVASAHSGRTDSNGGHYDRSTGEYHYHHGYPAHDHYDIDGDGDIDCPYKFKNNTNHNSSSGQPQSKPSVNQQNTNTEHSKDLTFGEVILIILKIIGISLIVLFLGCVIWLIINEWIIVPPLIWLCKKVSKSEVNEDKVRIASYIIVVVIIITITALGVLVSEGIL